MKTSTEPGRARRMRTARVLLAGVAFVLAGCGTGSANGTGSTNVGPVGSSPVAQAHTSSVAPPPTVAPKPKTTPVHIKLTNSDGATYGVGMPIIAYFSRTITNAAPMAAAIRVTANGNPVTGGWYFESSAAFAGYPIEAHWRPQNYWPAHSQIHADMPFKGLSAGGNMTFDNGLTSSFSIGDADIATVDDTTHQLILTVNGKTEGTYPVSLGATDTPTARGIKVIMEKGAAICMSGPGYHECGVQWTQRLTYGGEYLHAAPWNVGNLGRFDSSNGCTNLSASNAKHLYDVMGIGDVVTYPNANGPKMTLGGGYGDWNVPWSQWETGGLVPTT